MFDPASTHPYHVLENPAQVLMLNLIACHDQVNLSLQQQTGENSEAETVEEHGLYVPTAVRIVGSHDCLKVFS